MEANYSEQIARLREECAEPEFLSRLFGIKWPPGESFSEDYMSWEHQRSSKPRCKKGELSRWTAELFMEDHRIQPSPWAAASLGMKVESLKELLPSLPKAGLRRNYEMYPDLIDKSLSEDLVRSLKGLRFRTFGSHNSFCTILHEAILDSTGITPVPWYCSTSLELGEYERQFASVIDSIKVEGLSVKHSAWLDLGKPLRLAPDRCSKLFYAEHRDEMRGMIAGTGEPDGLAGYLKWLEDGSGAAHE